MQAGYARMASSSVVIAGLARDLGSTLPVTLARIEALAARFRSASVVLVENDSSDGTADELRTWSADAPFPVTVHSDDHGHPTWPCARNLERAAAMAAYRNRYLEAVRTKHADADYLIVLDTDLPDGFSYDGIANTIGLGGWDVVGSNGVQPRLDDDGCVWLAQYDAWAYRDAGRPEPHAASDVNPRRYERGESLIPVDSCFGGLAVYRMEAIRSGAAYAGGDCEHVPFHWALAAQDPSTALYIQPKFLNMGPRNSAGPRYTRQLQRLQPEWNESFHNESLQQYYNTAGVWPELLPVP